MHIISILMTAAGVGFLVLAGLLAHEALIGCGRSVPAGVLRGMLDTAIGKAVLDFDKDAVLGAAVPVILFMVLPGAALVNAALGGSPFLLSCYLLIAASVFLHMLLAERPDAAGVRGAISGVGAILALIVLPYYAVWSLTLHIVSGSPAEGAVIGVLIAATLYAANAGVWTLLHTGADAGQETHGHRFIAAMLTALPVGYVLYWFILLGFDLAGRDMTGLRGWMTLIWFSMGFAACVAGFKAVLDAGARSGHGRFTPAVASGGLGALAILAGYAIH